MLFVSIFLCSFLFCFISQDSAENMFYAEIAFTARRKKNSRKINILENSFVLVVSFNKTTLKRKKWL